MSYPNPNPNPMLGHKFIAPDTISYCNLYQILSGGTLNLTQDTIISYICMDFYVTF